MNRPKMFDKDIDPNDIRQGMLPDCWLLSALSSMAEMPEMIQRLFISKEYNPKGIYKIRLCKNGEWVVVTVDDYIPCFYKGGPIFSRASGDELWVLLLEKAYAKLHGHYYSLRYGFTHHGLMDLTGCPTKSINFGEEEDIDKDELYQTLKEYDDLGFLMTAETAGFDDATEGGGPSEASGLVPGHAYSLIAVKQHGDLRLLNIRNPWGTFEWDGDWGDESEKWTDEMKEVFNPVFDVNDGGFWMAWEDFIEKFSSINVCLVKPWEHMRLKGKFIRVQEEKDNEKDWVVSKFFYTFELEEDANVFIALHQEDERIEGAEKRPQIDMGFAVL